MNEWMKLVNEIKQRSPDSIMTSHQKAVCETILEHLQFPSQRINLFGERGTGKTLVAWKLVRILEDARHIILPRQLFEPADNAASVLIIDNAPHYEDELRDLMARASLLNVDSIVFISLRPVQLRMHQVRLDLPSLEDIEHAIRTIGRFNVFQRISPPPSCNFWQLLQCYA
ncbi:MAG: hypothetical protein AELANPGJ_03629 [Anaerolineae bacterium]|nr:hypothetical protein [Anaerolineae bacterium]